ncbi:hypothetical protein RSOLAG22IIIB_10377 [Rhizoctonia solani]|uniref:Uncharacterized protein n=1 Tax=Rhizoctonia solani TaxID=456999 RepID=A0A0K6G3C5_9AGAM|nr:hypothetical protein RSOLAG22IIIB_10377 [Rhizoctonia solani]
MQRDMVQFPDIEFPLVFSRHVSQVVEQEFGAVAQGLECDSILGWGSSDDPPVASREQHTVQGSPAYHSCSGVTSTSMPYKAVPKMQNLTLP